MTAGDFGFQCLLVTVIIAGIPVGLKWDSWMATLRRARHPIPPGVPTPSLSLRGRDYAVSLDADRTAVWREGGAPGTAISAEQLELSKRVFARLEDSLLEASAKAFDELGEWFEGKRPAPSRFAAELTIERVRVAPDVRDAVVYALHPAFSGHLLEISVGRTGTVLGVNLLG